MDLPALLDRVSLRAVSRQLAVIWLWYLAAHPSPREGFLHVPAHTGHKRVALELANEKFRNSK